MAKWIQATSNPLRYESTFVGTNLEFCGYEQHTTLELPGESARPVGLWNLIQMPHPGQTLISTYSHAEPHVYFGDILSDDLEITDHLISWRMQSDGEHKIGVRAIATTGRVGYLYDFERESRLVIRNFFVDPGGEYIDVP